MIILGIDSSTDRLGIGLADTGRIIFEDWLDSAQEHATRIIGMIDSVLSKSSLSNENLEGIAIADGPGSFTGLRIGMAAAKGMALALNIPIVGISPFEVVARRISPEYDRFFLAAVVRKGELFLCRVEGNTDIRKKITLVSREALPSLVGDDPVGLIGREPEGWPDLIKTPIPTKKTEISGGELAQYGAELIAAGKGADLATLEPLYIAPSQAEVKFGQKAEIVIREMNIDDLPEVSKCEKELFSDPWPDSVFREDIASSFGHPCVLQVNGEIAGYAILLISTGQGHLTNIAVAKKYQRKSIAKKLLSYILRLATEMGLAQIMLEVRPTNTPAISLYEKFGFIRLAVRKNYYRDPVEDCLIMGKEITGSSPK